MSYTKTNWQNTPSTQTPISAANLNHIEQGIYDATETADTAAAGVAALQGLNFAPIPVTLVADMTDQEKIYVYLGSEAGYQANHWYYWSGSAWTEGGVYNAQALATDTTLSHPGEAADAKATGDAVSQLNGALTKMIVTKHGANLVDDSVYIAGYYTAQGNIDGTTSDYVTSDYIDVEGLTAVSISLLFNNSWRTNYGLRYLATFDSNKDFIELVYGGTNSNPTYTVGEGVKYIRFAWNHAAWSQITLVSGSTPSPSYIAYREYYEFTDSDYAKLSDVLAVKTDIVGSRKSKNLYTGLNETSGYIQNGGSITPSNDFMTSDYVDVRGCSHISFSAWHYSSKQYYWDDAVSITFLAYYDENKNYLGFIGSATTTGWDVESGSAFIRFSYRQKNYSHFMVENSANPTAYEPYYDYRIMKSADYVEAKDIDKATLYRFRGKKICCFGDSLAASGDGVSNTYNTDTWIQRVADHFGMTPYNRGVGGSFVTNVKNDGTSRVMYAYVDANGDAYARACFSSQQSDIPETFTEIDANAVSAERCNTIPTDTDILIILIGANDANMEATQVYKDAFKAQYATMLDNIYARVPNARVLICTMPYHQARDTVSAYETVYNEFRQMVRDVAHTYGFPVIELRDEMMVNKNNHDTFMSNNGTDTSTVHFNNFAGRNRTADVIIDHVNRLYFTNDGFGGVS